MPCPPGFRLCAGWCLLPPALPQPRAPFPPPLLARLRSPPPPGSDRCYLEPHLKNSFLNLCSEKQGPYLTAGVELWPAEEMAEAEAEAAVLALASAFSDILKHILLKYLDVEILRCRD